MLLSPGGLPGIAGRGPACPVVWEAGGAIPPPTRLAGVAVATSMGNLPTITCPSLFGLGIETSQMPPSATGMPLESYVYLARYTYDSSGIPVADGGIWLVSMPNPKSDGQVIVGRLPIEVATATPANRVGGGIAPPASHTTGHAGPRPAIPGSPPGLSSTLSLPR